jgi:hypothetical protein
MHVELHIHQVLLEGARRADEMEKALQTLKSPEVILHRTNRAVDAPTVASYMGRQLYELIDGRRTVGDLVLQCRTSPYHAYSFLSRLVERDLIRVEESCEPQAEVEERDLGDMVISELQQLVEHEHYETALDLIDRHSIKEGRHDMLSMLIAKAEAGYLATAFRRRMPPDAVPHHTEDSEYHDAIVRGDLSSEELFLLEMVNGSWDVRSLVWISPMSKIDVIRGLVRLRDLGHVELHPPAREKVEAKEEENLDTLTSLDQAIEDRIGASDPSGAV